MATAATTAAASPSRPTAVDGPDPQPDDDGQPGEAERDDDEGEQAHRGGSGWASEP